MSFLKEHCTLFSVNEPKELEGFDCGDLDIDDFFANDCFGFTKQLLGKTYCYRLNEEPDKSYALLPLPMLELGLAICLMHAERK